MERGCKLVALEERHENEMDEDLLVDRRLLLELGEYGLDLRAQLLLILRRDTGVCADGGAVVGQQDRNSQDRKDFIERLSFGELSEGSGVRPAVIDCATD